MTSKPLTYKEAGVDIDAADSFVRKIKPLIKKTERPEVLSKIGHYAGLFALTKEKYRDPVLVASTDGVGTKLKVAIDYGRLEGLGQDLVAMSANDVLCLGAEPLFFLDYFATGHLATGSATEILRGITTACTSIHCALLGGETAEMPSVYRKGDFDLAGFIVGIVERGEMIDGHSIGIGHKIIGLASSGLHSNGFSLVRRILEKKKLSLRQTFPPLTRPLGEVLLEPTRLYVHAILQLKKEFSISGLAHITGGGFENLPRILPERCRAVIRTASWKRPPLFKLLQEWGPVAEEEMRRVFNCGIGLMLVTPENQADEILVRLKGMKQPAWMIGEIEERKSGEPPLVVV